jgi:hypothetical protein
MPNCDSATRSDGSGGHDFLSTGEFDRAPLDHVLCSTTVRKFPGTTGRESLPRKFDSTSHLIKGECYAQENRSTQ